MENETQVSLDISPMQKCKDAVHKAKDDMMALMKKAEEAKSLLRSLQDGDLNSPDLKTAMKDHWDKSLELSLSVEYIMQIYEWMQTVPSLQKEIEKYKAIQQAKKSKDNQ